MLDLKEEKSDTEKSILYEFSWLVCIFDKLFCWFLGANILS